MALPDGLRARANLVGVAAAVGVGVAAVVVRAWSLVGDPAGVTTTVFSLGALALGVGLLGWAGSIVAGEGIERMQDQMDFDSDWTEAKSRRAMARIGGFGAGVMLGTTLVGLTLV